MVEFAAIVCVKGTVQSAGRIAQGVEHATAMLQSRAFHGPSFLRRIDEQRPKQLGGIADRRHVHAGARPTHVGTVDDAGVDRRKTRGTADLLSSSLVQRHIFLGKPGGFLFLNAGQKTLYRRVTAIEFVVQI